MRPAAWVNCLAVFLLTAAVANCVSTAQAGRVAGAKPPPPPPPSWVVQGEWMASDDEAVKDALQKAQAKVAEYLRSQTPPKEWSPDPTWIQQNLVRDLTANEPAFKELEFLNQHEVPVAGHKAQVETSGFEVVGKKVYRAALRVEMSAVSQQEINKQEEFYQAKRRQERATVRQGVLVRVLAGLVALLAAVACYLRLEDATKGYYTALLRLAAVAFVALVGAGIWLLT
jgi:hypothetical protein